MRSMDFAALLYRQLPTVFRERDNAVRDSSGGIIAPGDLAKLLSAYGGLLDALYRTALQRYYDIFPDQEGVDVEGIERGCQTWVLPYIAQLLDVYPVSPLESGQRAEIANAIAWRQRKGTLVAVEKIAEAVAGLEVEIQEGWRLVAVTPRPGFSLLPASSYGERDADFDARYPAVRAQHPGLPNGTVDFRRASRAVRVAAGTPSAKLTRFSGDAAWWRQINRHDVPCFPDSFQDVSGRTADVRTPTWRHGHIHPRRVLLHAPRFDGYFSPHAPSVQWTSIRDDVLAGNALAAGIPLELSASEDGARTFLRGLGDVPVKIRGIVELDAVREWHFENIWFDNKLDIDHARVFLEGCALRQAYVHTIDTHAPVITARNCLFKGVLAPRGMVLLEYCTVMERIVAEVLQASDSIFMSELHKDLMDDDVPRSGCIRYSRLTAMPDPMGLSQGVPSRLSVARTTCTSLAPIFIERDFGKPGCGVLHPASSEALRFGAEDSGEMGAYHALRYTLREQAVIQKLAGYLPVGVEAVLVPDGSLSCIPPMLSD